MRETLCMVEGDYDDVELATEGSMTLKVMALLLKPLLQRRRVDMSELLGPLMGRINSLRGFNIINPASAVSTAQGAPSSSTPPHQQPEGLRHHRPHLHHSNSLRSSAITFSVIDPSAVSSTSS
jgi:hypothetical protein